MKKSQKQLNLEAWIELKEIVKTSQDVECYVGLCYLIEGEFDEKTELVLNVEVEKEGKRLHKRQGYHYWSCNERGMIQRIAFINRQIKKLSKKR